MFHLIDESLEAYIRGEVPLAVNDVDVSFERPDREWGAAVTRPTVSAFLWDVRRNSGEQEAGVGTQQVNGRAVRRAVLPRVDCRYLVTAWAGDVRTEHQLLGSVLGALLRNTVLLPNYLSNGLGELRPLPVLNIARFDGTDNSDFWTAIGGELRPALDLTLTVTFDTALSAEAGPPVTSVEIGTGRVGEDIDTRRVVYSAGEERNGG